MYKFIFSFVLFAAFFGELEAQCSDAGVCSIGDAFEYTTPVRFTLNAGYNYGIGSPVEDVNFQTLYLNANLRLYQTGSLFLLWNAFNIQTGPLGTVRGIGDILLIFKQHLWKNSAKALSLSAGFRLATGSPNADPKLPQVYQPGLGTNDILLGLNYSVYSWQVQFGYQYVQRIYNANAIDHLKRGDDIYGEVNYTTSVLAGSMVFKIMGIKRLKESEVSDGQGGFITVPGSAQAQVNLAVKYSYGFGKNYALSAEAAFPLLKREVNVDGLTRYFTFSIQLGKKL